MVRWQTPFHLHLSNVPIQMLENLRSWVMSHPLSFLAMLPDCCEPIMSSIHYWQRKMICHGSPVWAKNAVCWKLETHLLVLFPLPCGPMCTSRGHIQWTNVPWNLGNKQQHLLSHGHQCTCPSSSVNNATWISPATIGLLELAMVLSHCGTAKWWCC